MEITFRWKTAGSVQSCIGGDHQPPSGLQLQTAAQEEEAAEIVKPAATGIPPHLLSDQGVEQQATGIIHAESAKDGVFTWRGDRHLYVGRKFTSRLQADKTDLQIHWKLLWVLKYFQVGKINFVHTCMWQGVAVWLLTLVLCSLSLGIWT